MAETIRTNNEERASETIARMDEYLKGYTFNRRLLQISRMEDQYFHIGEREEVEPGEPPLARARMFEIRHFIMGLPNGDEKMLLYYHYVRGETVDRCAQMLGISRASGFRMRRRALLMAARYADLT